MKKRLKYSIILIITLFIGIVLGFIINGRLVNQRINKMKDNFSETGFGREIKSVILPTPEQEKLIKPIFRDFASSNHDLMNNFHDSQKKLFSELKEKLTEVLDEDQIKRLDDYWHKKKRKFQRNKSYRSRNGYGRGKR
jgi:hypothetical protein